MAKNEKPTGLALMREPFEAHHISKLPKPTKKQTDDLKAAMNNRDFSLGIRCKLCGGWHHKDVVHLDYVGHAALTDRLLNCDPEWNWEPTSFNERGAPALDGNGGMWIKLTVCGVTRLGYGDADGKSGGNAVKEAIGDALRNAAMRFGAALDLWHKGDLHVDDEPEMTEESPEKEKPQQPGTSSETRNKLKKWITGQKTTADDVRNGWGNSKFQAQYLSMDVPHQMEIKAAAQDKVGGDLADIVGAT